MSFLFVKQAQRKSFLKINTKTFKTMQSPNIMTYHNECASVIKEKPTAFFDILISNLKKQLLKKNKRNRIRCTHTVILWVIRVGPVLHIRLQPLHPQKIACINSNQKAQFVVHSWTVILYSGHHLRSAVCTYSFTAGCRKKWPLCSDWRQVARFSL